MIYYIIPALIVYLCLFYLLFSKKHKTLTDFLGKDPLLSLVVTFPLLSMLWPAFIFLYINDKLAKYTSGE